MAEARAKTDNFQRVKKAKSIKQKIRGIRRLLQQPDLPATVRVTQERMLQMLEENVREKSSQDAQKKYDKKYKMVKFFEKRKCIRRYKQCSKRLETCPQENREDIEREMEKLKRDINYITYFPSNCKYISIYPRQPYTNSIVIKQQEAIYELICSKVAEGKLKDALEIVENTEESPIKEAQRLQKKLDKRERMRGDKKQSVRVRRQPEKEEDRTEEKEESMESSQVTDSFFLDPNGEADEEAGTSSKQANPKFVVLGAKDKKRKSNQTEGSEKTRKMQKKEEKDDSDV